MLLCVDLDGVVYRGSEPVPGVGPLLTERVAGGDRVIYVTNNSFLRRVEYRSRIEACGAPLSTHGIITAASAVAQHFVDAGYRHILVYGAEGLAAELRDAGLDACRTAEFDGPESLAVWGVDAVTVGLDRESDWHDLAVATDAVRAGAPLIVPNRDANYPDPGRLVPGHGCSGGGARGGDRRARYGNWEACSRPAAASGGPRRERHSRRDHDRRLSRDRHRCRQCGGVSLHFANDGRWCRRWRGADRRSTGGAAANLGCG